MAQSHTDILLHHPHKAAPQEGGRAAPGAAPSDDASTFVAQLESALAWRCGASLTHASDTDEIVRIAARDRPAIVILSLATPRPEKSSNTHKPPTSPHATHQTAPQTALDTALAIRKAWQLPHSPEPPHRGTIWALLPDHSHNPPAELNLIALLKAGIERLLISPPHTSRAPHTTHPTHTPTFPEQIADLIRLHTRLAPPPLRFAA